MVMVYSLEPEGIRLHETRTSFIGNNFAKGLDYLLMK